MNPLISICVPVYNVEAYVERCMHSLLKQTYANIEYVIVDDCSTDKSLDVIQSVIAGYPQRKAQIHILHNDSNHGLAYTRRVSIEAATGEYILCVDSDDYIELNMVKRLYQACNTHCCDIVIGGYLDEKSSGKQVTNTPVPFQHNDFLLEALEDRICRLSGKLVRRSLFSMPEVSFAPEGMDYLEDRIVLLYLSGAARYIDVIPQPLYHYILHDGSISYNKTDKHFRCLKLYWELADAYLAQRGLTDRYRILTDRQKLSDKISLLHFCKDISTCKRYAGLFPEAEAHHPQLSLIRGVRLTRFLTKYRLWTILRIYKQLV